MDKRLYFMRSFIHSGFGRSPVLKYLSVICFLLTAHVVFDMGNYACPDEGTTFSIHLLSFKSVEEAKAKVKEFKDLGNNAFYKQEITDDKTTVYNVYIERFRSRAEAEKEAKILKELDLISDYDIREITEKAKSNPSGDSRKTPEKTKNNAAAVKPEVKGYYLKVSSLKEKANAEEMVIALQNAGYHAFYNYESIKGKGDWYRVYLDEYQSKEDAEKDAKKLIESGIISGYEIKRATGKVQPSEIIQKDENKIYSLHVASYKDSVHADEDVRRLTEYGLKAISVNTEISGEQWFRVYIGEFSNEKEAREKGAELRDKGTISYFKPFLIDKTGK
jgi:cell division septation protein DedD